MATQTTYHGKPELKAAFLAQITAHEQADAFVKGFFGRFNPGFRGCAIGCSVRSLNAIEGKPLDAGPFGDHPRVAQALGFPPWLAYLEGAIFIYLPDGLYKTWPRRFAAAMPVGIVIDDAVLAMILAWLLTSDEFGVIHAASDAEVRRRIATIAASVTVDPGEAAAAEQEIEAWDDWESWSQAWDAWDEPTRSAWDATNDAWDAWAARNSGVLVLASDPASAARKAVPEHKRDDFYPALSDYLLKVLSER